MGELPTPIPPEPFSSEVLAYELGVASGRHPNHQEISQSHDQLVDMLQRRRDHWLDIKEMSQRQMERAVDTIASCDQQLVDLNHPNGQQLSLEQAKNIHDGYLIYDEPRSRHADWNTYIKQQPDME